MNIEKIRLSLAYALMGAASLNSAITSLSQLSELVEANIELPESVVRSVERSASGSINTALVHQRDALSTLLGRQAR